MSLLSEKKMPMIAEDARDTIPFPLIAATVFTFILHGVIKMLMNDPSIFDNESKTNQGTAVLALFTIIIMSMGCGVSWVCFAECVDKFLPAQTSRRLSLIISSAIAAAVGVIVFYCEDRGPAFWCLGGVWSQLAIMVGIGAFVLLKKPADISL